MNCHRVERLLSDHLDGLLPDGQAYRVETHLQQCRACRRLQEMMRLVEEEDRELANGLCLPDTDVEQRAIRGWMMGAAETQRGRRPVRMWQGRRIRGLLVLLPPPRELVLCAAVAAVLVATLGQFLDTPRGPSPIPAAEPSAIVHPPQRGQISQVVRRTKEPERIAVRLRTTSAYPVPAPSRAEDRSTIPSLAHGSRGTRIPVQPSEAPRLRPQVAAVGDLGYLNGDSTGIVAPWARIEPEERQNVAPRVASTERLRDDFVQIPLPRLASTSDLQMAAAAESYNQQASVVDARLVREVSIRQEATALVDLCELLTRQSHIRLRAGASVADEKVTVFCEKVPLRDLMRQLSRPFGYTWLRTGKENEYRYELVQELRSQLNEEDLRSRARNAALVALDEEMQRYRAYLSITPDEARALAKSADPGEKPLLEALAGAGWGPIHMYFRLPPRDFARLRAGETLTFGAELEAGAQPLPADIARGVLASLGEYRVRMKDGQPRGIDRAENVPEGQPLTSAPGLRSGVSLALDVRQLGECALKGAAVLSSSYTSGAYWEKVAIGISPAVRSAGNRNANAALAKDHALRPRVTVEPKPSCWTVPSTGTSPSGSGARSRGWPRVTSADVLEALHEATKMPLVADYYTRNYAPEAVTVKRTPLFDALSQLSDTMRLRWKKEGAWLQFRSTSFFDDRLREVPNRLLLRWAAARQKQGSLPLEDLLEIAQLTPPQLDSEEMAEGARDCFGLIEWDLARDRTLRDYGRTLAHLAPAQLVEAQRLPGLPFARMTLPQQQHFLSQVLPPNAEALSLSELLATASLRLVYEQPGSFQWTPPAGPGGRPNWSSVSLPLVREPTPAAALLAARRFDPRASAEQIAPAGLALRIQYRLGNRATGGRILQVDVSPGRSGTTGYSFGPE
jgi:hypothetical protein